VVRISLGLSLLLAACQAQTANSDSATGQSTAGQTMQNEAMAMAAKPVAKHPDAAKDPCDTTFDPEKCVEPDVRVDAYVGTWVITNVAVDDGGAQAFAKDDPAIVGSEFSIARQEIRWTKKASNNFTADDVCGLPSAGAMSAIVEKEEGVALLSAAISLAINPRLRGTLHRFGCVTSGRWGPGDTGGNALFYPIGNDRMLLQWYDGAVLMAEKLS
jgi:hypothetical protein